MQNFAYILFRVKCQKYNIFSYCKYAHRVLRFLLNSHYLNNTYGKKNVDFTMCNVFHFTDQIVRDLKIKVNHLNLSFVIFNNTLQ